MTVGSRKENCSSLFPNPLVYNAPILCSRLVACYTGKRISSVNGCLLLEVPFSIPTEKIPLLGTCLLFLS